MADQSQVQESACNIAKCPDHGLHGERTECYVCGGEVEQVPMVPLAVAEKLAAALAEIDTLLDGYDVQSTITGIERVVAEFRAAYPREERTE